MDVFGWGDARNVDSPGDRGSSKSSSVDLLFLSFLLKSPLSIPGFFSLRFFSSLDFSGGPDALSMLSKLPRPSFHSLDRLLLLDSSRNKFGVREIFFGSAVSSLKNESVFRTVPFLDRLTVGSIGSQVSS